jgi:hypothetical protein
VERGIGAGKEATMDQGTAQIVSTLRKHGIEGHEELVKDLLQVVVQYQSETIRKMADDLIEVLSDRRLPRRLRGLVRAK